MQFEIYFKLPSKAVMFKTFAYLLLLGNFIFITTMWLTTSSYYLSSPADGNGYIAWGRITGLYAQVFLLLELILIGRIRPLEHLFGFDQLNRIHRYIGYSILTLIFLHPILLTVGNAQSYGVSVWAQFIQFLATKPYVVYSFAAVVIFVLIVVLAVFARKHISYETWYFTHLLTYVAIGLALPHELYTGDLQDGNTLLYYWYTITFFIFGLILVYRWIRPLVRFAYHRFKIDHVVQESADCYSLYISGNHLDKFKFESGQYANINILARGMWTTHPFSFSSAYNGKFIRFTIKCSGDYTNNIGTVAPGTSIIIDGPLGLFVEARAKREKFLLIGGGIGVTPLSSLIDSLVVQKKDIVLMYAVRTSKDLVFKDEFEKIRDMYPTLTLHYIVSAPEPGFESGRIDKEKIVRLVPDFFDREVYLCGPPPMMNALVGTLKELGFSEKNLHYEKFSF